MLCEKNSKILYNAKNTPPIYPTRSSYILTPLDRTGEKYPQVLGWIITLARRSNCRKFIVNYNL